MEFGGRSMIAPTGSKEGTPEFDGFAGGSRPSPTMDFLNLEEIATGTSYPRNDPIFSIIHL